MLALGYATLSFFMHIVCLFGYELGDRLEITNHSISLLTSSMVKPQGRTKNLVALELMI